MNDIIYVGKHTLTYSVTKHLHSHWELIYCTGGSGEMSFSDRTLRYEEDSLTVIPPMLPHVNHGTRGFTNIHIVLANPSFNTDVPIVISGLKNGFMRDAFSAAFYFYSGSGAERGTLLPIYGQLIAAMLETMISGNEDSNEVVHQIIDTILKNYPDPNFDLNSCLESFSFSTEYLKRIFKQEAGMTPRQYLMEMRLDNAAKILAVGDESQNISQIARQCGFQDPLYFSKLFKRKYGVSPKYYKQDQPVIADSDSTKIYL